jgi:hypothetical protein
LSVREFARLQGAEQTRNLKLHAEECFRSFYQEARSAEGFSYTFAKGGLIANFYDCLERGREVRTGIV